MTSGQIIRLYRRKRGLTQQGLAELVDVEVSTVARWEHDEISSSLDNAKKVAEALGVSLDEMAGREEG